MVRFIWEKEQSESRRCHAVIGWERAGNRMACEEEGGAQSVAEQIAPAPGLPDADAIVFQTELVAHSGQEPGIVGLRWGPGSSGQPKRP